VPNFWAPVSQIVPVLALTLVLEARRLARRWRGALPAVRICVSLLLVIAGFSLWQVESWALTAMVRGVSNPSRVDFAQVAIVGVLVALALQPLVNLFVGGNTDTWTIVWRVWPWSKWARTKRSVTRVVRAARKNLVLAKENRDAAQVMTSEWRRGQELLAANTKIARSLIATAEEAGAPADVIEQGRMLLETGVAVLESDAKTIEELLDVRRRSRQHLRKAKKFLAKVEAIQSEMKLGRMTESERLNAESMMDRYLNGPNGLDTESGR